MVCYYHPKRPAIGVCKHCQRGLCADCAALVDDTLACKDRHEDVVRETNLMRRREFVQSLRIRTGYVRNAVFYCLVGGVFSAFGLIQYRFLGLEAAFFLLIGLFLLYAGAANYIESRKY